MYEYIKGTIAEINPASVIVEAGSIGYLIHISLNTYSKINSENSVKVFLHQIIREDAHLLYGFADVAERELFRLLISVSGIGSNTAMMMLSSLSPDEIRKAILGDNVLLLKSIKGIGAKTAQRIIIDLKDKIGKTAVGDKVLLPSINSQVRDEALAALTLLGFTRKSVESEIDKILKGNPSMTVEMLIKTALKGL